jgi:spore coat protein H
MKQQFLKTLSIVFCLLLFISCYEEIITNGLYDWEDESHSNEFEPNYDVVFNQSKVNRIDIVLTATEFDEMQIDMNILSTTNEAIINPKYFACDFYFNGKQWYDVGIRYKSNKKAYASFLNDIGKLPLKLNFDEFETQNPDLKKQRFYGFQELSLEPNFNDNSLMREKIASELFNQFGVPVSKTAYYELHIDKGDGNPVYFGLYTMTEDIENTILNRTFLSNTGNCYKADGDGAKFDAAIFTLDSFENITNKLSTNKEDVQQLNDILNSSLRISDLEAWKSNLEAIFDVDGFLKYLAVNNTIQNWDTYGNKKDNYYLYNDPKDNLLKWVVNNTFETLKSRGDEDPISIGMLEVSKKWTLIYNLIRVEEYKIKYKLYIEEFINLYFTKEKMDALYEKYKYLIAPSVLKETSNYTHIQGGFSAFESEVENLIYHTDIRLIVAERYIR